MSTLPPLRTPAGRISLRFKQKLYARHGGFCQYCGWTIGSARVSEPDHIVPTSLGGSDDHSNIRLSCTSCNSTKRDHDLEHLRRCLRVKFSVLHGVISAKQAQQLLDLGVELPHLGPEFVFHFERPLLAMGAAS
jgi:hypothetical protein